MKRFTEDEFDDDFYGDDDELRDLEIPVLTPGRLRERAKKRNEQKQNSKGPDSGRYYKNNRDDYEDYPEDNYYGEEDYPDEDSDAEDPYRESGYYEEEGYAGDAPGQQYDDPGADREQTGQESADGNPRGQKRSNRSVEDRAARVRQARGNTERRRKKKRRRRSPVTPALVAVVLILFTVGCATAMKIVEKFSYSNERESLTSLFPDDPDRALVIMNGEITEDTVLLKDSELYFTLEQAHELSGNTRLYMDSTGSLLYTTPTEIITSAPGDTSDSSGASGSDGKAISFVDEGGAVYISAAYLKNYCRFSYTLYEDPYRVSIITEDTTVSKSRVHKDSHIRTYADRKSPILADVARSETVRFLEEEEKWSKVMTDSGVTGYIETKELSAPTDETITPDSDYTEPEYSSIHMSGTVNMSWLLVYQQSGESLLTEYTANTKALNVISPTWMSVSGGTGDIVSYGTKAFVDKAHDMGLQVWPMLDDFTSGTGDAPMVLSSLNYRTALVNNIMAHLNETGSDGLNLDFENVPDESGKDYVEFIRELSIACRLSGKVLSIDNYVPTDKTDHYDRAEQGKVADYVVIMGYDEHYSGSEFAGSVASIDFVRNGIEATLEEVPAEKIINAVPFYTRVWSTTNGEVSSKALGMKAARDYAEKLGIEFNWDDSVCQYYGENQSGDTLHQAWLEEADSISAKLSVMKAAGIAGVSSWCLNYETPDVWDVIEEYVNAPKVTP